MTLYKCCSLPTKITLPFFSSKLITPSRKPQHP